MSRDVNCIEFQPDKIYYKYRAVRYNKYLADIFLKNKLYCSEREALNDPMEGVYSLAKHSDRTEEIIDFKKELKDAKSHYKICSFSDTPHSLLMWSHYADSCQGIAIGFKLKQNNYVKQYVDKVNYLDNIKSMDSTIKKNTNSDELAREILFTKLVDWKYEKEYRALTINENIEIEIVEVRFGPKISDRMRKKVKDIINKTNSKNRIKCIDETIEWLENSQGKTILSS